jgi:uncharacterized protein YjbI with pentapeptide repeats
VVVELESEKTSSVLEREALADWNTCHVDGCIGISNAGKGSCLGHLNEDEQQAVLQTLPYQRPLDLRGVTITEELFARLSAVMEHDDTGRLILHDVDFTLATFLGEARFDEMIFLGRASFMLADFHRIATFLNADFRGEANFEGTHFGHGASFDGASFQRLAQMNAIFSGAANFNDTTFHDMATFYPSTFGNDARFTASVFQREAWFRESICYGTIYFEAVRFNDETDFRGLRAFGDVRFEGALFERARRLGPMLIAGELVFDEATFRERIQITADGPVISCERTRFSEGLNLRAKWARISLDHSDFSGSSILTHSLFALQLEEHAFRPDIDEAWFLPYWQAAGGPPRKDRSQPWIASLCGANVTGASIANLDLRACIIADAHNLDKLRLEGSRAFSRTPTWKAIITSASKWCDGVVSSGHDR